jgi:hypothetical protein
MVNSTTNTHILTCHNRKVLSYNDFYFFLFQPQITFDPALESVPFDALMINNTASIKPGIRGRNSPNCETSFLYTNDLFSASAVLIW